jgi:hypothetical protein
MNRPPVLPSPYGLTPSGSIVKDKAGSRLVRIMDLRETLYLHHGKA